LIAGVGTWMGTLRIRGGRYLLLLRLLFIKIFHEVVLIGCTLERIQVHRSFESVHLVELAMCSSLLVAAYQSTMGSARTSCPPFLSFFSCCLGGYNQWAQYSGRCKNLPCAACVILSLSPGVAAINRGMKALCYRIT
jgi:hypothetical protein